MCACQQSNRNSLDILAQLGDNPGSRRDAMSRDPKIRARRHKEIQRIFEEGFEITEQKDLVHLLSMRGFDVTQSSVSRDLRDLGAIRRNGLYEIPGDNLGWDSFARIL